MERIGNARRATTSSSIPLLKATTPNNDGQKQKYSDQFSEYSQVPRRKQLCEFPVDAPIPYARCIINFRGIITMYESKMSPPVACRC